MEQKTFYNVNAALDYAESIGVDLSQYKWEISANGTEVTKLGQKAGFDIDGFCEVVPLIYVSHWVQGDGYERKEIRFRGRLLHIISTNTYYYITRMDKDKYGLESVLFIDTPYNTFKYYRTELTAPQNIGKATKTKVLNWIQFADAIEREKLTYWQEKKCRIEKALNNIRTNCPNAVIREVGETYNKYEFQGYKVICAPQNAGIEILYEFDGCGSIGTSYRVVYDKANALSRSIIGE